MNTLTLASDEELLSMMNKLGRECGSYAAISSQFNRRRDVENRRSIVVRELHKRGLIGYPSSKRLK